MNINKKYNQSQIRIFSLKSFQAILTLQCINVFQVLNNPHRILIVIFYTKIVFLNALRLCLHQHIALIDKYVKK